MEIILPIQMDLVSKDERFIQLQQLIELKRKMLLEKQKKYTNNIIIAYIVMFVMIICMTSMLILGNNNYNNSDYELYGFYGNILFKYYYITNILWYLGFIFMSIYLIVYILHHYFCWYYMFFVFIGLVPTLYISF